jgi:hypothetical protein
MRALGAQRTDSNVTIFEQFLANLDDHLGPEVAQALQDQGAVLTKQQLLSWLVDDRPPFAQEPVNEGASAMPG